MTWQAFTAWLEPFIIGAAVGFFWYPIWAILKKIWHEASLAKKEWNKSNGKPN
jgi:hypothetical protein